ncbi:MAG: hypothetical protein ACFE94_15315 [Candidatus Hodarchaeota archaeon]
MNAKKISLHINNALILKVIDLEKASDKMEMMEKLFFLCNNQLFYGKQSSRRIEFLKVEVPGV